MDPLVQALIGAAIPFLTAGVGFWIHVQKRFKVSNEERQQYVKLLMGLAHSRLIHLGLYYMNRGWITKDEYDDYRRYLYEPYTNLGGNGTAERIMRAVERLPFKEEMSLLEDTFKHIPIRHDDPTGFWRLDKDFEDYPYEGEERREQDRKPPT